MSGTSLDGLDMAWCRFSESGGVWSYRILKAETVRYPKSWRERLAAAHRLSGEELVSLHIRFGLYLAERVNDFCSRHRIRRPECVASHGHTVFHQPSGGFTFQLGDGAALHAATGMPVVCDFRSLDVQLGGQGAPLVPIGDRLLFSNYAACVNLGGIANISMERRRRREAWDICFVNLALNHLAGLAGKSYDRDGAMARKGKVDGSLLDGLRMLHGQAAGRPSLGREDFERGVLPLLDSALPLNDRLRTAVEYVALEVSEAIRLAPEGKVLLTGGGAHHGFLVERLNDLMSVGPRKSPRHMLETASDKIIDFKEALVFAFLGVLRLQGRVNVLASVTGARSDSSSGVTFGC